MSSLSRQQITKYLQTIDVEGQSVLDIGSGKDSPYKVTKWVKGKPYDYKTLDISKDYNPDYVGDINIPLSPDYLDNLKSDVVFCLEVLEHCWNPVEVIQNLLKMSKNTLVISTPFINPIHDTWDYLRYTEEWFLDVIPKFCSPKDIKIIPRTASLGSASLQQFYKMEGLRMSKIRLQNGEANKMNHIGYIVEVLL